MTHLHGMTASERTTGLRDITAMAPAAWLLDGTSYIHIDRTGPFCTLTLYRIKPDSDSLYLTTAGFAPPFTIGTPIPSVAGSGLLSGYMIRVMSHWNSTHGWAANLHLRWYYPQPDTVNHQVIWRVNSRADMPDPANLPGAQVTPPNY